jgi:hypothetical protein
MTYTEGRTMAFQKITSLDADTTISLGGFNKKLKKDNPTCIEGYYLGNKTVPDAKKKSGVSYIHFFQTPKGNVGVWGKTDMDKKLAQADNGTMIRVTHSGMKTTLNGEMYVYTVEADSDNRIAVAAQAPPSLRQVDSFDEDEPIVVSASFEDLDDEDAVQEEALRAAEARKAKVNALLKKKA